MSIASEAPGEKSVQEGAEVFSRLRSRLQDLYRDYKAVQEREEHLKKEVAAMKKKQKHVEKDSAHQISVLQAELAAARGARQKSDAALKALEKDVALVRKREKHLKEELQASSESRLQMTEQLKQNQAELALLSEKQSRHRSRLGVIEEEARAITCAVDEILEAADFKEACVLDLRGRLKHVLGFEGTFIEKIKALESKLGQAVTLLSIKEAAIRTLEEKLESAQHDNVEIKEQIISRLTSDKEELAVKVQLLEQELEEVYNRCTQREEAFGTVQIEPMATQILFRLDQETPEQAELPNLAHRQSIQPIEDGCKEMHQREAEMSETQVSERQSTDVSITDTVMEDACEEMEMETLQEGNCRTNAGEASQLQTPMPVKTSMKGSDERVESAVQISYDARTNTNRIRTFFTRLCQPSSPSTSIFGQSLAPEWGINNLKDTFGAKDSTAGAAETVEALEPQTGRVPVTGHTCEGMEVRGSYWSTATVEISPHAERFAQKGAVDGEDQKQSHISKVGGSCSAAGTQRQTTQVPDSSDGEHQADEGDVHESGISRGIFSLSDGDPRDPHIFHHEEWNCLSQSSGNCKGQIGGGVAIRPVTYCDFENGISPPNVDVTDGCLDARTVHRTLVIQLPPSNDVLETSSVVADDESATCICNVPAYGEMMQCKGCHRQLHSACIVTGATHSGMEFACEDWKCTPEKRICRSAPQEVQLRSNSGV